MVHAGTTPTEFNADDRPRPTGASRRTTISSSTTWGRTSTGHAGNSIDDANGRPFGLAGVGGGPFAGLNWQFDETGAGNQDTSSTFVVTSSILRAGAVPAVRVVAEAADWLRSGAAPFSPFSGTQYMAAGADRRGYKRLTPHDRPDGRDERRADSSSSPRTSSRTGTSVAVEAQDGRAGRLDDAADTTGTRPQDGGLSCPSDWRRRHRQRCTRSSRTTRRSTGGSDTCTPPARPASGTRPPAARADGGTGRVDLSQYAGKQVEVSIAVISDRGTTASAPGSTTPR